MTLSHQFTQLYNFIVFPESLILADLFEVMNSFRLPKNVLGTFKQVEDTVFGFYFIDVRNLGHQFKRTSVASFTLQNLNCVSSLFEQIGRLFKHLIKSFP